MSVSDKPFSAKIKDKEVLIRRSIAGVLCALCLFTVGYLSGADVNPTQDNSNDAPYPTFDTVNVDRIGEASILPTTNVIWEYTFDECGHVTHRTGADDYIGFTKDDIESSIKNSVVDTLNASDAKISVHIDELCPQHFLLILTDEATLCIFRTDEKTLVPEVVMELDFVIDSFDDGIITELKDGIVFDSLEQIDAYLEYAES